jgi:hypothetical protein
MVYVPFYRSSLQDIKKVISQQRDYSYIRSLAKEANNPFEQWETKLASYDIKNEYICSTPFNINFLKYDIDHMKSNITCHSIYIEGGLGHREYIHPWKICVWLRSDPNNSLFGD